MGTALDQPSELAQGRPDHAVACHPRRGVAPLLGQLQQLLRGLERRGQLAALEVHDDRPYKAGKISGTSPNSRHSSLARA